MADEIVKFDPSKLVDQVRERIRNTFAELIPEEEWKRLVEREIADFLKPSQTRRDQWGRDVVDVGHMTVLVRAELAVMLKTLISEELRSPKWSSWWDGNKQNVGTELKNVILEQAPEILAQTLGQLITISIQSR